jgi:4-carboxymuconolactone decarboxylase
MTGTATRSDILSALDTPTRALVRLAAAITASSEQAVRQEMTQAVGSVQTEWVEELILQSYLFAGFPRALNAAREWRRISGRPAPAEDHDADERRGGEWRQRGERTCAIVYGRFYEPLRHNIAELHPALDAWMIVDGYGKVLSRPGLDLKRRELCIVAACAACGQDRQLHSHLHGALHAGASEEEVDATLAAIGDMLAPDDARRFRHLWSRVRRK